MNPPNPFERPRPFKLQERLFEFACDIVRAVQYLHTRGPIASAFSYQLLDAGTSVGSNAEEADGASSRRDFVAKMRISLKEAKETRFRLRVCRRCELLDQRFDPLVSESDKLVRIIASIVHRTEKTTARKQVERGEGPGRCDPL
jgi:four helix bundle protein